jgi:hypothetical protein
MIKVDNFSDYRAIIIGRLSRYRDCLREDIILTPREERIIRDSWDGGIAYPTAVELVVLDNLGE